MNKNNSFLALLDLLVKGYESKDESSKCCESYCKECDETECKQDKVDDEKKENKKFSGLLDYLDDCLDAYYDKLQKYIDEYEDEVENNKEEPKECNCARKIEIKDADDIKEKEKKTEPKKILFLDSMYEVPENIKNNVTNCAVEYFDKIIYPVYDYDEKERKHIIETLADFMCWFYKNK